MSNYHKILGVPPGAGKEVSKKAYRKKAMQYHPDRNSAPGAEAKFLQAHQAYEALYNGRMPKQKFVRQQQRAQTPKEKWWNVYHPPRNPQDYQEWRKVAEERGRQYAKMDFEAFKKDFEAFKKTPGYYFLVIFNSMLNIILVSFAIGYCWLVGVIVYNYPNPWTFTMAGLSFTAAYFGIKTLIKGSGSIKSMYRDVRSGGRPKRSSRRSSFRYRRF